MVLTADQGGDCALEQATLTGGVSNEKLFIPVICTETEDMLVYALLLSSLIGVNEASLPPNPLLSTAGAVLRFIKRLILNSMKTRVQ
ncbi:MAG: hypothetical protein R3F53_21270 [Gammaproteobacteria bacterium]